MREIHRTLTTRLPILVISVTCGCALNFGQVNASGTVNATADTKIDTTINASASVGQNGGSQQTASPVPSATPTASIVPTQEKGKLVVKNNFSRLDGLEILTCGLVGTGYIDRHSVFLIALNQNIIITKLTYGILGNIPSDDHIVRVKILTSNNDGIPHLPYLQSGLAEFTAANLMVLPKDKPVMVNLLAAATIENSKCGVLGNYSYKKIGFSLNKIGVLGDADITGEPLPLNAPLAEIGM